MEKGTGPSEAQLEAALEGARDMVESSRGAGRVVLPGEDAGFNPAEETGGPRGSGYPPSRTTGGRVNPDHEEPVEPDEFVKRETAVFIPGTQKKPA